MIGCDCEVCTSDDPRDRRTRPSIFVRVGGCHFLVDAAPELRLQCLANNIKRLDAVLFTHHHADHVMGLDDLRRFNWIMKRKIPCYGSQQTVTALQRMFSYAFDPKPGSPHSSPQLELHAIDLQPFAIGGATIIPIPLTPNNELIPKMWHGFATRAFHRLKTGATRVNGTGSIPRF